MICMRCQQEGKCSTVAETGGMTTLIHYAKRYDENGKPIAAKDGNKNTTFYSCSNGHQWTDSNDEKP